MTKEFNKWRPHPWHGLDIGDDAPAVLNVYIEITPFDFVKYEIDKKTGYLRVDRPAQTSSLPPTLYGFVPRTYCGDRVSALMPASECGDTDPLDICVISSRRVTHGEVIMRARVLGGIPMLDGGEADDKIIAVLDNDDMWLHAKDIEDLPASLVQRLRHYFATYKTFPGQPAKVQVDDAYGREQAIKVIEAAIADYADEFGGHD
jgi:inorganic pyrophosphatase